MNFVNKLFSGKPTDFISPMRGIIIPLDQVHDEVFASKSIGDGFAIIPEDGKVYAPVEGEIEVLFPTLHAIGIRAVDRNQYLIHIGLDSVKLQGQGFKSFVKQGAHVRQGDLLIEFELENMKNHGVDLTSPVIITNLNGRKFELIKTGFSAEKAPELFRIRN